MIHLTQKKVDQIKARFFARYGFEPIIHWRYPIATPALRTGFIELFASNLREPIASFVYEVNNEGHLVVRSVEVKSYRQNGLNTYLLGLVLLENPNVTTIIAELLVQDNSQIYADLKARGYSERRAFMMTPAYKSRASFGFTRIQNVQGFSFETIRP